MSQLRGKQASVCALFSVFAPLAPRPGAMHVFNVTFLDRGGSGAHQKYDFVRSFAQVAPVAPRQWQDLSEFGCQPGREGSSLHSVRANAGGWPYVWV